VVLRLEGKGVDVDANRRDVGVVLVGLDQVEILALALREPIVAVELDLGYGNRVVARKALYAREGVAGVKD